MPREHSSSNVMMLAANASRAIACAASLRLSRDIQPPTAHPLERTVRLPIERSPVPPPIAGRVITRSGPRLPRRGFRRGRCRVAMWLTMPPLGWQYETKSPNAKRPRRSGAISPLWGGAPSCLADQLKASISPPGLPGALCHGCCRNASDKRHELFIPMTRRYQVVRGGSVRIENGYRTGKRS